MDEESEGLHTVCGVTRIRRDLATKPPPPLVAIGATVQSSGWQVAWLIHPHRLALSFVDPHKVLGAWALPLPLLQTRCSGTGVTGMGMQLTHRTRT